MDPRWIIPFAANLLLMTIGREVNHYLAPFSVSVMITGLMLPVAALRLTSGPSLFALVLTGLAVDAFTPTAFGATSVILATGLLALRTFRQRIVHDSFSTHLAVGLVANLIFFVVQPFLVRGVPAYETPTIMRILVDLVLSQALVAALAWWFFALQERALVLWGVNLAEESRELH